MPTDEGNGYLEVNGAVWPGLTNVDLTEMTEATMYKDDCQFLKDMNVTTSAEDIRTLSEAFANLHKDEWMKNLSMMGFGGPSVYPSVAPSNNLKEGN